jgi:putative intracellular protease/amidase
MWDLATDPASIALIERFYTAGKPVAAVCHAPAALLSATDQGAPLVKGKRVTGFANSEEEAVELTGVVPFLLEDALTRAGGHYEKAADWADFTIVDGRLVTGQNPASSASAARAVLDLVTTSARTPAAAGAAG